MARKIFYYSSQEKIYSSEEIQRLLNRLEKATATIDRRRTLNIDLLFFGHAENAIRLEHTHFDVIFNYLEEHPEITQLFMTTPRLVDVCDNTCLVHTFALKMKYNSTIEHLNLSDCNLYSEKLATALIESLKTNNTLVSVNFGKNSLPFVSNEDWRKGQLTDNIERAILDTLQQNFSLQEVNFDYQTASSRGYSQGVEITPPAALERLLSRNKKISNILIGHEVLTNLQSSGPELVDINLVSQIISFLPQHNAMNVALNDEDISNLLGFFHPKKKLITEIIADYNESNNKKNAITRFFNKTQPIRRHQIALLAQLQDNSAADIPICAGILALLVQSIKTEKFHAGSNFLAALNNMLEDYNDIAFLPTTTQRALKFLTDHYSENEWVKSIQPMAADEVEKKELSFT